MQLDPNESRYFDEKRGCTLNTKCNLCKKLVWARAGIYTVYDGYQNLHNREDRVMSVWTALTGIVCTECYELVKDKNETPS